MVSEPLLSRMVEYELVQRLGRRGQRVTTQTIQGQGMVV